MQGNQNPFLIEKVIYDKEQFLKEMQQETQGAYK